MVEKTIKTPKNLFSHFFCISLQPMIIEKVLQKLGIEELNAMQQEVSETILHQRGDVVVLSPTGSGKTLAYLLPLVQLLHTESDEAQALVVVPGRELALQSDRVLKSMSSGLRSAACYGGRTAMDEHRKLREVMPHIIFGTPGRLNDHLDKGNINPNTLRYIVIDEFDKCLEMGFHDEMSRLLKKLPGVQRRFLLSATDAEQIPHFIQLEKAHRLNHIVLEEQVSNRVMLYEVKCPFKDKLFTLRNLLCQLGNTQSIVFLNFRDAVGRVDDFLRHQGFATSAFHGGMDQKQREDALYKFSNGSANVFVSTDLASRGLDIPDIQNIIHYHLPLNKQEMVHRVGRTARWNKHGQSYFLVGPEESLPGFMEGNVTVFKLSACRTVPVPRMITIYIGKGKNDKLSKGDIVGFLCKKGGLEPSEIGRVDVMDRYAYAAIARNKIQQVLRQVRGEKIKGIRTVVEPVK
jgi:superfamily II DNA/RNA helicase